MTVAELVVRILFQTNNPQALPQVKRGLKDAAREATVMTAGINAVNLTLTKMVSLGREAALSLTNFQLQTGGDTMQLQRWQGVLEAQHVSGGETLNLFKSIKDAQAAVRLGTGNVAPFQFFGLDVNEQDTGKVLNQIIQVLHSNLDPNIIRQFTQMLGLTDDIVAALKRADFNADAPKEGLLLTDKQKQELADFDKEWMKMKRDLAGLALQLATDLLPAFESIVHGIEAAVKKGQEFIAWLRRPENEQYRASLQRMITTLLILGPILAATATALLTIAVVPFSAEISGMIAVIVLLAGAFDTLNKAIQHPLDSLNKVVETIAALGDLGFDSLSSWITGVPTDYQGAQLTLLARRGIQARGGAGHTVNVTNNNNVNIDGAMSPKDVGRAVGDQLGLLHTQSLSNVPALSY